MVRTQEIKVQNEIALTILQHCSEVHLKAGVECSAGAVRKSVGRTGVGKCWHIDFFVKNVLGP